jgi:hypothetical protein
MSAVRSIIRLLSRQIRCIASLNPRTHLFILHNNIYIKRNTTNTNMNPIARTRECLASYIDSIHAFATSLEVRISSLRALFANLWQRHVMGRGLIRERYFAVLCCALTTLLPQDSEVAPQLQTSSHGRIELRRYEWGGPGKFLGRGRDALRALRGNDISSSPPTLSCNHTYIHRQLALLLLKQPGYKSTQQALMHCGESPSGRSIAFRTSNHA